ncbi:MAG: FHA domain-containing protein [Candidatus Aminicenantes bacterium]|nr:FHA domain-containing protein [Candidatus Aminicenantes bacterium]
MMKCISCGNENPAGIRFCEKCGRQFPPLCNACGHPVKAGTKFCANCGIPLTSPEKEMEPGFEPPQENPYFIKEDGSKAEIEKDKIIIGRHNRCDFILTSPSVSAKHARLEKTEQGCFLTDLRSTNGTLVNGQKISSTILYDGDRVNIGTGTLIFHDNLKEEDQFVTKIMAAKREEATVIRKRPDFLGEAGTPAPDIAAPEPELPVSPPRAAAKQPALTAEQVQKLGKKMEKGMPSPIYQSSPLSVVLFADETLTWAGKCLSEWYFGPNQKRELHVGVTELRFILYHAAETGRHACQSYWYDVDFGGQTWKSGFKTWRAFTSAPPELKKKKIELFPREIREDGKIKTLLVSMPLESLKVPVTQDGETKYKKDPEKFFATLQQSYESRKPVSPPALFTLLNDPLEAEKIPGSPA